MNGKHTRVFSASRRGFTFLEIMLVVVIIGILASLIVPRMAGRVGKAKAAVTKSSISGIETALGQYEATVGSYPSSEQGLKALVERPSDVPEESWDQQLKEMPKDGWNREFIYKFPGEHGDFDIISLGADGKQGTKDDITNFKAKETASN